MAIKFSITDSTPAADVSHIYYNGKNVSRVFYNNTLVWPYIDGYYNWGTPSGVFATLAQIQAQNTPTSVCIGTTYLAPGTDNKIHWYYFDGGDWQDGGLYYGYSDLNNKTGVRGEGSSSNKTFKVYIHCWDTPQWGGSNRPSSASTWNLTIQKIDGTYETKYGTLDWDSADSRVLKFTGIPDGATIGPTSVSDSWDPYHVGCVAAGIYSGMHYYTEAHGYSYQTIYGIHSDIHLWYMTWRSILPQRSGSYTLTWVRPNYDNVNNSYIFELREWAKALNANGGAQAFDDALPVNYTGTVSEGSWSTWPVPYCPHVNLDRDIDFGRFTLTSYNSSYDYYISSLYLTNVDDSHYTYCNFSPIKTANNSWHIVGKLSPRFGYWATYGVNPTMIIQIGRRTASGASLININYSHVSGGTTATHTGGSTQYRATTNGVAITTDIGIFAVTNPTYGKVYTLHISASCSTSGTAITNLVEEDHGVWSASLYIPANCSSVITIVWFISATDRPSFCCANSSHGDTCDKNTCSGKYGFTPVSGGCFEAGTQVLMADGSTKNIEDVLVGDEVMSYDIAKKEIVHNIICKTFKIPEKENLAKLSFDDGTVLNTTTTHPFYTTDGWVSLRPDYNYDNSYEDLAHQHVYMMLVGQEFYKYENGEIKLVKLQDIQLYDSQDNEHYVYNLDIARHNTFFTEGILGHNAKVPNE